MPLRLSLLRCSELGLWGAFANPPTPRLQGSSAGAGRHLGAPLRADSSLAARASSRGFLKSWRPPRAP